MIGILWIATYVVLVLAAGRIRYARHGNKRDYWTAKMFLALPAVTALGFLSPVLWGLAFLGLTGYAGTRLYKEQALRRGQMREALR